MERCKADPALMKLRNACRRKPAARIREPALRVAHQPGPGARLAAGEVLRIMGAREVLNKFERDCGTQS